MSTCSFGNNIFSLVCRIEPLTDVSGRIEEFSPHTRFKNSKNLSLHEYGSGPFCKFRIPSNMRYEGVYVLTLDEHKVQYVGECLNLASRYNMGYGNISPRNCYRGGQMTNCRINHLVYEAARVGHRIALWFFETPNRKTVEAELIQTLRPDWNRKGLIHAE